MEADEELEFLPGEEDELLVDESLGPVEAIATYGRSDFMPRRIAYVKSIGAASATADEADLPLLVAVLQDALRSSSGTHAELHLASLQQIGPLSAALASSQCHASQLQVLLQLAADRLACDDASVVDEAFQAYAQACRLLPGLQRGAQLASHIQQLTSGADGEGLSAALRLLALLEDPAQRASIGAGLLDACEAHKDFHVREALAANLASLAAAWGDDAACRELLLRRWLQLADDEVWKVREAAMQALPAVAARCGAAGRPEQAQQLAARVQQAVEQDVSQWVRHSALQQLGRLICEAAATDNAGSLLQLFSSATVEAAAAAHTPAAVLTALAEQLPAVAEAAGALCWDVLQPAFEALASSSEPSVAAALVPGLPRLLVAAPAEAAAGAIAPAAQQLLERHSGDVRVRAALAPVWGQLAAAAPAPLRAQLVRLLQQLADNPHGAESCRDWRIRLHVAGQLAALFESCSNVSGDSCHSAQVVKAALQLCRDPVSAIRQAAAQQVAATLAAAAPWATEPPAGDDGATVSSALLEAVLPLGTSMGHDYQSRMVFVHMCTHFCSLHAPHRGSNEAAVAGPRRGDVAWRRLQPVLRTLAESDVVATVREAAANALAAAAAAAEPIVNK